LREFDESADAPSIRALASALGVAPSAIYHHYESQAAIVQAATELVWEEATRDFLAVVPDPYNADPVEVLVTAGIATRRAFGRHYRIAPFLAASPETTEFMAELLGMLAGVFERLGLRDADARVAFHTYTSFTIGSVLFAATRRVANEKLGIAGKRAQKTTGRLRSTTRSTFPPPTPHGTRNYSRPACAVFSRASCRRRDLRRAPPALIVERQRSNA
jgi:AcrR family transcriptional regulator